MPQMHEQADRSGKAPLGAVYSWILTGLKRSYAQRLPGWKWVTGRPGCFVTNDPDLAASIATREAIDIKSNGTHAAIGAPVLLCDPNT